MQQMLSFSIFYFTSSVLLIPVGLWMAICDSVFRYDWQIMLLGSSSPITMSVELDKTGVLFSFVVFFISGNVCLFSVGYLEGELFLKRFSYLLFSFIVSMNMLIYSGNLVTILLGWDGLGLTSFLLVIYYQNSYSLGAGLITVLTNRLGDVMLLLLMGLVLTQGFDPLKMSLLLVVGAMTKSAQYPFSSWLPMAMAAPTPVSSLVHSSTLVTAGVFLMIRFSSFLCTFDGLMSFLLMISSVTMVLAGLAALFEVDFKKIIAYSTLSQLGVMVVALSLGSAALSLLHLLCHAMFKALMFVCAGVYIFYHKHGQDLRNLGGLMYHLPFIHLGLLVSNLSLCGFPFFSGFYSKDPIYEFGASGGYSLFSVVIMFVGLFLTSAYSIRAFVVSQVGNLNQFSLNSLNNSSGVFIIPVGLLGGGALIWGASLNWLLLPPTVISPMSFIFGSLPVLSAFMAIIYFSVSFSKYSGEDKLSIFDSLKVEGLTGMWFLSSMSSQYLIKGVAGIGGLFLQVVDQGWVEISTAQGANKALGSGAKIIYSINSNSMMMLFLLGIASTIIIFSF